ncbi:GDSL esterase/lipase At5g55050-like [Panicum virgatum]|uniref:GDSL esterase/lipase n=1 Tax=Panicum virgatum TaxID=38727 RepID=A0A8T0QAW7_PANVG|nr:GDSL esterase/lipase At5g55050-like [Panicum virgatum]XP_039821266.1 GDSL esterase/lipase At5g55050-like [Panicum virgatum]XP_039821267.1 GDSL esterase/lipase At5g55050-like [Panicum virgatum]XP_039821268.1 GDSL esterase/lipase At5g55050-like [Panicum virgatum]XP_039821269.1 GDSL esterase/lipase At5g55050-like [Panicum virgatum]XP_039821270.1 GDSL esterase/lipase At5g55050-like [Panicum virgatum]XP_039821271.1 GDSL esterase/lipase At5g55050-like [Panicum virgatum]XP_039821273.1 GDSL ester
MASHSRAFSLVALCLLLKVVLRGTAETLVPAVFVFGDSMVDIGNNNFIEKCNIGCKANYPPFGIDYLNHTPTGRFSNGYNLADQLAQLLHFDESPPPFLSLSNASLKTRMRTGINFASGGSGLLIATGNGPCTQVFSMTEQVRNFTMLARKWGRADLMSKSLIFINTGSNDLFEYTFSDHNCSRNDTEFLQSLVASYRSFLMDLYGAGAKKFSVVSPSLVGCCPSQRAIAHDPKNPRDVDKFGCFAAANNLSWQLYPMIATMLHDLCLELPGMNYSLVDSIKIVEWVFYNTVIPNYNFTVLDMACCGGGPFGADGCNSSATLCQNRNNHLFWDDYHPTTAATGVAAKLVFDDTTGLFVHPINLQQLIEL